VAGLVFGKEAAQGQIVGQIQGLVGEQGAKAIQAMIENGRKPSSGIAASLVGLAMLLIGASGVLGELHDALNTIWKVRSESRNGLIGIIKDRFLSFTMVLGTGFLMLVSLVASAALAAVGHFLGGMLPSLALLGEVLNFLVSFGIITLLFAMIYKYLPDLSIPWNDVWIGAAITALLFTVGKFLIGFYLSTSAVTSAYGAASSLAITLIWIYYSAQIFFFGAEFTQVYSKRHGSRRDHRATTASRSVGESAVSERR
jgi:membrane protein